MTASAEDRVRTDEEILLRADNLRNGCDSRAGLDGSVASVRIPQLHFSGISTVAKPPYPFTPVLYTRRSRAYEGALQGRNLFANSPQCILRHACVVVRIYRPDPAFPSPGTPDFTSYIAVLPISGYVPVVILVETFSKCVSIAGVLNCFCTNGYHIFNGRLHHKASSINARKQKPPLPLHDIPR